MWIHADYEVTVIPMILDCEKLEVCRSIINRVSTVWFNHGHFCSTMRICFIVSLNRRFMAIVSLGTIEPSDSNTYLVKGSRNILVDTGLGLHPEELLDRIAKSLGSERLDAVVLTHCHIDHIGGLKAVAKRFGCKAYAHKDDAVHIRNGDSRYTLDLDFGIDAGPMDVEDLEDGRIIDIGDHRLEVIHTPGHTEGCICLYDRVTKALITGDTLFINGMGRTDLPGGSFATMIASLKKLAGVDFDGIYPGHGEHSPHQGHDCLIHVLRSRGVDIEDY